VDLTTEIAGIKLENPLMPASGPLVGDYEKIMYIASLGVGGVVTKTISTKPAEVPRPCIYGAQNYVMNSELWSELPPEKWIKDILPKLRKDLKIPLIVSLGYTKEDMEELVPEVEEFADAFEISTHYIGKDVSIVGEIVDTIRKYTEKPIFMKLSPHIPDPVRFAEIVKERGGDGIVAINSLGPTMMVDLKTRSALFGKDGYVWISGPVIKPLALAMVNMVSQVEGITVIGVGGIRSSEDILEFLLVGAKAVQMLSSALIFGKDIYRRILKSLPGTLEKYGFQSIREVVETSLRKREVMYEPRHPRIDLERCTFCKVCEMVCPYFAIVVKEKDVVVDGNKCFGCGLCETRCPTGAISGVFSSE